MKQYDMVYVTNVPAFYKIRLWNEIARKKTLLVIFTGFDDNYVRNDDFSKGERHFNYVSLQTTGFAQVLELRKLLHDICFNELIVAGNNMLAYWYLAFTHRKNKLSGVCESSIYESKVSGIKGFIKKWFTSRFSKYYVSGTAQKKRIEALGFKGEIIITHGVGIFNFLPQAPYKPCSELCNKLLFVGRLSPEKNLIRLIEAVNRHPQWELTIVGFGPQEDELKRIAAENITFMGPINNEDLPDVYRNHDAFVLPSTSEPYGLVVEEALNNGIPVALSDRVGCQDDWTSDGRYGLTFSPLSIEEIECGLKRILHHKINNEMRKNIALLDFEEIERKQVECYL